VNGPLPIDRARATPPLARLEEAVARVVLGKAQAVRHALTALLARGHLLIEDVPGVGKTTLARTLARTLGGTFRRIQFTSDLLPPDIIGVSVYDPDRKAFDFKRGPIFADIVLADEINRTTPRTQSCLLEAMSEGQVSVDGVTYELEQPFMVIATQNPQEHYGTYPLPESQMDRFLLRVRMGYPDPAEERRLIATRGGDDPVSELRPVVSLDEIRRLQGQVDAVRVDDSLLGYVQTVVHETRRSPFLSLGVSPRGAIAWYRAAQAHAIVQGRAFCVPSDFKGLATAALAHRVVLGSSQDSLGRTRDEAERILSEVLERIPIPE
jgi:MoxR-like ATPase